MEKQWAVWTGEFDNDAANWYEDHDAAIEDWHTIAQGIPDGDSAYMQRFNEDGTPDEDYAHELRRDGDDLMEYYGSERCWVCLLTPIMSAISYCFFPAAILNALKFFTSIIPFRWLHYM